MPVYVVEGVVGVCWIMTITKLVIRISEFTVKE